MDFLDHAWLGNSLQSWLIALGVCLLIVVGALLIRRPLLRHLRPLTEGTATSLDDMLVALLERTETWFLVAAGVFVGSLLLTLPGDAGRDLRTAFVLAALLQGGIWGNQVLAFLLGRSVRHRVADDAAAATTLAAVTVLGKVVLWAVVLLSALANLGVNITALLAGLGVGGIAVALAAQNVLVDLFASMAIVLDKPFVLGDQIVVGDKTGTVEHIGLKTTRLRSLSGEQLVFSNSKLLSMDIRNFKRMEERRVLFTLGLVYQTPVEKMEAVPGIIREIIEAHPSARFDRSHFKAFGPSSLDVETVYFVLAPEYAAYMAAQQSINLAIMKRFAAEGLEFAYPTQTLYHVGRG